jgi:hypothetical protein
LIFHHEFPFLLREKDKYKSNKAVVVPTLNCVPDMPVKGGLSALRMLESAGFYDSVTSISDILCQLFDLEISCRWGVIQGEAERAGKSMPVIDGLIAVSGLVHNCIVVTRNIADMEQSSVELINPWPQSGK